MDTINLIKLKENNNKLKENHNKLILNITWNYDNYITIVGIASGDAVNLFINTIKIILISRYPH